MRRHLQRYVMRGGLSFGMRLPRERDRIYDAPTNNDVFSETQSFWLGWPPDVATGSSGIGQPPKRVATEIITASEN